MKGTMKPLSILVIMIASVAFGVTVIACGGASGGSPTRVTAPSPAPSAVSSARTLTAGPKAVLDRAQLVLADLPAGWSVEPSHGGAIDNPAVVCGAPIIAERALAEARSAFVQQTEFGASLLQRLAVYPLGQGKAEFEAIEAKIHACPGWTRTDSTGQSTPVVLVAVPQIALGDQSLVFGFSYDTALVKIRVGVAVVRRGDTLNWTIVELAPESSVVWQYARIADEKLAKAIAASP